MALARIIASLASLGAGLAEHYKEVDGQFVLDIEGDSLEPLVNAKNHEKAEHQKTKELLSAAKEEMLQMRRGAVSKEDLDAIEVSYKEKIAKLESDHTESSKTAKARVEKATIKAEAQRIAAELSDSPALMLPYIAKRLSIDFTDDHEAIIRVRGADGKASALTLDDLKKDLVANPDLLPIIRGSKGTGGHGTQQQKPGGGAATKLNDMTEQERVALYKSDPDEFQRLKAEALAG